MKNKKTKTFTAVLLLVTLVLSGTGAALAAESSGADAEPAEIRDDAPQDEEEDIAASEEEANDEQEEKDFVVTKYKSEESEQYLWDTLSKYSPSDTITAGILAMFWRESFYRSDATAHWATVLKNSWYDQATDFTNTIDAGLADGSTKDLFIEKVHYAIGGYGLSMWYGAKLLDQFYDFAQEWGTSISDAEMQCAFAVESMKGYEDLWKELQTIKDPALAGARIGLLYDGSSSGYGYIGSQAKILYEKYSENAKTKK
ncbi:MAG: hypothetical protein IJ179_06495 [Oscillospiraceae bacterium]|nr:hypothetical protein [Oscillospiraceae bacterium]